MKKCFLGIMLLCFCIVSNIYADNALQLRQFIGGSALCGWYHNEQYLGTEVIYNNKPWVLLGIGPSYTLTQGNNGLKLFGYFALTSNVAKKQWPIEKVEVDTFIIPKLGAWNFCFRTRAGIELANNNALVYWGEDYIGYQVTKALQFQFRTEWKHSQGLHSQSIGPAWSSQISSIKFNGYIGMETKHPYAKTGWLELRMVTQ